MTAAVCPSCGAAVRADSPWCTLCYADLRAEPSPPAPPEPAVVAPVASPEPAVAPAPAAPAAPSAEPTWPCTSCGTLNPLDRDTCSECGRGFMAAARDPRPRLELPVIGDIARLSRAQRLALIAGVVLAIMLLTLIIGLVLG